MAKRYFEFSDDRSNKFWEVWREGVSVFTRYGKIGATGQLTVKKLGSDADAKKLHDKLVGEKTGKGYVEAGGKTKPAKGKPAEVEVTDIVVVPENTVRLEVVDGKSSKFWLVHRKDKTVTVTFGKIGTSGTASKKKYKTDWDARSDVNQQIRQKKLKGYLQVVAGPRFKPVPSALNPQLEAAIVKGDDDSYMVYGDWLMEQGDPRGAMASIAGADKKSQNKAAAIAWKHKSFFYGPLGMYAAETPHRFTPVVATWRHGWMDTLRLTATRDELLPVGDCGDLVALLPKVVSSRLVRELVIGCPRVNDEFTFFATMHALTKALPNMPNLRRLVLGDFHSEDSELSWSHLGSMKDVWKHLPKLEYLKIHAGNMDFGTIDAPELRELWIESGGFDVSNLDQLIKGKLPKLEVLNLWMGEDNYGCDIRPKHLATFIAELGKKFPKLRHLGLANSQWGNEIAPLLVRSKILKQVSSINLSMSHLTDEGMRVYAEHKDAFKHLTAIDFSRCLLGTEGNKLAKTLGKHVEVSRQDDPTEYQPDPDDGDESEEMWRYAAVGE